MNVPRFIVCVNRKGFIRKLQITLPTQNFDTFCVTNKKADQNEINKYFDHNNNDIVVKP